MNPEDLQTFLRQLEGPMAALLGCPTYTQTSKEDECTIIEVFPASEVSLRAELFNGNRNVVFVNERTDAAFTFPVYLNVQTVIGPRFIRFCVLQGTAYYVELIIWSKPMEPRDGPSPKTVWDRLEES